MFTPILSNYGVITLPAVLLDDIDSILPCEEDEVEEELVAA